MEKEVKRVACSFRKLIFLLGLVALFIIMLIYISYFKNSGSECTENKDCVPSECCHSDSCVGINERPNCTGVFCTMECAPDTLDCGQKSCKCFNGECGVA